jgi:epidermal growth factor receptor substrate 15
MSGKITTLPPTLPPGLYEIASDGTPSRNMSASPAPIPRQSTGQQSNLAPIPRQATGQQQYQQPTSPIAPNMTGGRFPSQPMQPNVTGGSFNNNFSPSVPQSGFASAFAPPTSSTVPWDVSPAEKASSDKFFDGLDKSGRGILEGDVAVPFMLESKLSEVVLAAVWDLADVRKEGNLTKDEFAVAMYLIKGKLAGRELPEVLPASLVPPSLRNETNAPAQQQQPSATRDLFDAFGDSPPSTPAPAAASSAFSSNADNAFGMSAFGQSCFTLILFAVESSCLLSNRAHAAWIFALRQELPLRPKRI